MKYLIVILFMLFSMEVLAQATPSGYTTFLGLRKYDSGSNPGADSLNTNLDDIDLGVKTNDDTLGAVKADLYNFASYSGDLQSNVVGVDQLKTGIDTSHVKTTGADIIYGVRYHYGNIDWGNSGSSGLYVQPSIDLMVVGVNADLTINGNLNGVTGAKWSLPDGIPTNWTAFGYVGTGGASYMIYNYGISLQDTLLTWRQLLLNDNLVYGDWTFSGVITQQEVHHQGYETKTVNGTTLTLNGNTNSYELSPEASYTLVGFSATDQAQGDIIMLINTHATNTITLSDASPFNLTAGFVMGEDDNIMLYYDGTLWVELSRSNN